MNLRKNVRTLVFSGLVISILLSGAGIYANGHQNKKEYKNRRGVYIAVPKKMLDMMKGEKKVYENMPKEFYLYTEDGELQKLTSKNPPWYTANLKVKSQNTKKIILVPKSEFKSFMKEFKRDRLGKEQRKECKQKLLDEVKALNLTELGYPAPEKIIFSRYKGKKSNRCGKMNENQEKSQRNHYKYQ